MADFGKLNFAVAFVPQTAFPLDGRTYFESLEAAQAAAATAVPVGSSDGVYHLDIVSNRIRLLRKSMVFLPRILSESFNLFA